LEILQAIVLGIVQGLTEFLPISSSAHLILVPWLFGWEPFGLAFDVALHLGTLAAILIYFRHDLIAIPRGLIAERSALARRELPVDPMARLGIYIVIASIPAGLAGLLGEDLIDRAFHADPITRSAIVAIAIILMLAGITLEIADRRMMRMTREPGAEPVSLRQALIIGLAQTLALIPGASRSGTTIAAGLFVGLSRPDAARFSFLLGVPLIAGAGTKQMLELATGGLGDVGLDVFAVGVVTAALTGYAAIAGLLRFLQRRPVTVFVVYRILLGIGLLILLAAGFEG
jgi:undecaprenyl-diphosphatase